MPAMRLQAAIDVFLPAEAVLRSPTLWDRAVRAFGGQVDLGTDRARAAIAATDVIDQVRSAIGRLGITNAISLVIDDQVIFRDEAGRSDDLGDLVIAMSEHAPVFGAGFRSLRMAVEHEEGGLHAVVEAVAQTEHKKDEPVVAVRVGARVRELETRPGEEAEQYRARIEPLLRDPALLESHRRQFGAWTARLADALRAAFPEGRVDERAAEATVVRPTRDGRAPSVDQRPPQHPGYDPYVGYYRSPFDGLLAGMMIGSFMSGPFYPHVTVVSPSGMPIGTAEEVAHDPDSLGVADVGDGGDDAGGGADEGGGDGGDGDGGDWGDGGGGDWGGDFGD
jgi:hypothetical protein